MGKQTRGSIKHGNAILVNIRRTKIFCQLCFSFYMIPPEFGILKEVSLHKTNKTSCHQEFDGNVMPEGGMPGLCLLPESLEELRLNFV